MYPQFFGFDKLPFRLRPDPDFLYLGHEYLRARTKLLDDLRGRARVVLLTGPAGVEVVWLHRPHPGSQPQLLADAVLAGPWLPGRADVFARG